MAQEAYPVLESREEIDKTYERIMGAAAVAFELIRYRLVPLYNEDPKGAFDSSAYNSIMDYGRSQGIGNSVWVVSKYSEIIAKDAKEDFERIK